MATNSDTETLTPSLIHRIIYLLYIFCDLLNILGFITLHFLTDLNMASKEIIYL